MLDDLTTLQEKISSLHSLWILSLQVSIGTTYSSISSQHYYYFLYCIENYVKSWDPVQSPKIMDFASKQSMVATIFLCWTTKFSIYSFLYILFIIYFMNEHLHIGSTSKPSL